MRLSIRLLALGAMMTASVPTLVAQRPGEPLAVRDSAALTPVPCTYARCALRVDGGYWRKSLVRGEQAHIVARLDWPRSPHIEHVFDGSAPAVEHAAQYARAEHMNRLLTFTGAIAFGVGVTDERPWNGLTIGGAALLLASLPYEWLATRSLSRAVSTYNAGLPKGPPLER